MHLDGAKAHLDKYDSLDILDQCYFRDTAALGTPSWRPNWNLPEAHGSLPEVLPKYLTNEGEPTQAGLRRLRRHGAEPSTVTWPTFCAAGRSRESSERGFPTVPTPDGEYPFSGETWLDAFRRTVVLDLRFLPAERGFSMVFPDDPHSKEEGSFLDRTGEARPAFLKACMLKRLAYRSNGMMGVVRPEVQIGDRVAVLVGSKVLHCLREVSTGVSSGYTHHQLVGEAYFHRMTDGQVMEGLELGKVVLV